MYQRASNLYPTKYFPAHWTFHARPSFARPKIVKSSFCRETEIALPELGPATTEAELDALFNQIDAEIALDPEMTQDLLDILNDEDEEMDEDDYEEPQG